MGRENEREQTRQDRATRLRNLAAAAGVLLVMVGCGGAAPRSGPTAAVVDPVAAPEVVAPGNDAAKAKGKTRQVERSRTKAQASDRKEAVVTRPAELQPSDGEVVETGPRTMPEDAFLQPAILPVARPAEQVDTVEVEVGWEATFEPVAVDDVRSIDFQNFRFPFHFGVVPAVDGYFTSGELDTNRYVELYVDDVVYGDIDGDGSEDAAVVIRNAYWYDKAYPMVQLFTVVDGQLTNAGATWSTPNSEGGYADVEIRDEVLITKHWSSERTSISESVWGLQDGYLDRLSLSGERQWFDLSDGDPSRRTPNGSEGAVRASFFANDSNQPFKFQAAAGWAVTIQSSSDMTVRIRRASDGQLVDEIRIGEELVLPGAGEYVARPIVAAGVDALVDFDVSDQRTLRAPRWETRSETDIVASPTRRQVTLSWPEVTWAAGAADLDSVNATIRNFIAEREQAHAQSVTTCTDDEAAIQSITYRMTLVSYDLLAIDFSEFICLCESGDTNRTHTLVIDMNTGAAIDVIDPLVANSADFVSIWKAEVLSRHQWDGLETGQAQVDEIVSISMSSSGIAATATVSDSGLHPYEMMVTLSFDQVANFIDPALVIRAQSGAAALLPQIEACGC